MHIVHIIEATATGTLSMVELLANRQVKTEKVTVIYSIRHDTPPSLNEIFDENVQLIYIDMSGLNVLKAMFYLRQYFKKTPNAVIHCHSSIAGFLGRLSVWGLSNPCFYSPHCIAFMRTDINELTRCLFIKLEKLASIFGKHYIACSVSEASAIRRYLPHAHIETVENAIDFETFPVSLENRDTPNYAKQPIQVITVGGIRKQKNPHAFAQIATACPYPNVRFTWIGDGDDSFKNTLKEAGVHVTGWCSRMEVLTHVNKADIYLSTALWEGLPVALIEAQYLGKILLVNDCPGNVDVVEHMKTGYVFSNIAQANEMIDEILEDVDRAKAMAQRGNAIAKERFGVERYCKAINSVYHQNLG